jgi:hypothetical protein
MSSAQSTTSNRVHGGSGDPIGFSTISPRVCWFWGHIRCRRWRPRITPSAGQFQDRDRYRGAWARQGWAQQSIGSAGLRDEGGVPPIHDPEVQEPGGVTDGDVSRETSLSALLPDRSQLSNA